MTIYSSAYIQRRTKLQQKIGGAGYALSAYAAMQQTPDAAGPFIQEANFLYLTGIEEPGWRLIVDQAGKSTLVAPDVSEIERIFDGGLSDEEALRISGVNAVISKEEGDAFLKDLLSNTESFGALEPSPYDDHLSFTLNPAPKELYHTIAQKVKNVRTIRKEVAQLRAIKSPEELSEMQKAIDLTVASFKKVKNSLQNTRKGGKTLTYEYELDALFTFAFRNVGATHAYEPIVAAGMNACTLHYAKNSEKLPQNGLVLMDVGAKVGQYSADITRTYAIGVPTDREIAVHAAVEKAHHEIIALIAPGYSVKTYHEKVDEIMKAALKNLGLLKAEDDYRRYFPHAISHGLGLDVHDPLGGPEVFEPGMVLTVEPGIYIPEEAIGVRIEDDILVTETGNKNLSGSLSTGL